MSQRQTIEIEESGMLFGPFQKETVFHIENSRLYSHVNRGEGSVPTAEFLLLHRLESSSTAPSLWIVEAKSSAPRPGNKEDFGTFIQGINAKLASSLILIIAAFLGRHPSHNDLPMSFLTQNYSSISIKLILVLRGHKKEWLEPISDALQKTFKSTARIWNFHPEDVVVLNDEMARKQKLIRGS